MTTTAPSTPAAPAAHAGDANNTEALARDWITLWQSELAALATDREAAEVIARAASLRLKPHDIVTSHGEAPDERDRAMAPARADATPRPASVAAASGARGP